MKILRIRRGFTTNSSAYTEWLPPPPQGSPGGQNGTVTTPPQQNAPQQPPSHAVGNGLILGGIVAALVGVFTAERLLRRFRRKKIVEDENDE